MFFVIIFSISKYKPPITIITIPQPSLLRHPTRHPWPGHGTEAGVCDPCQGDDHGGVAGPVRAAQPAAEGERGCRTHPQPPPDPGVCADHPPPGLKEFLPCICRDLQVPEGEGGLVFVSGCFGCA